MSKYFSISVEFKRFIILNTELKPSLNIPAAMYAEFSTTFSPKCRCFGDNRQTVALKLSFAFCVWPPSDLWRNLRILVRHAVLFLYQTMKLNLRFEGLDLNNSLLPLAPAIDAYWELSFSRHGSSLVKKYDNKLPLWS